MTKWGLPEKCKVGLTFEISQYDSSLKDKKGKKRKTTMIVITSIQETLPQIPTSLYSHCCEVSPLAP